MIYRNKMNPINEGGFVGMINILIVEDDDFIREILKYALTKEGYEVIEAANLKTAYECISKDIELAMLDVMLPDGDGFSLCKHIIEHDIAPVIMLTARNDISDKLTGLNLGAEDYISKPFDIREVIARVKIVLRRSDKKDVQENDVISLTNRIKVYKTSHEVEVEGKLIKLKRKEFKLLLTLIENKNVVLSREKLLDIVWGYDFIGDTRTVDVHVQRLRKKLGETKENSVIKTVFGVGYKLI